MYSIYFKNQYLGHLIINGKSPLKTFMEANSEFKGLESQLIFNKI
jgi:hypothetical protein